MEESVVPEAESIALNLLSIRGDTIINDTRNPYNQNPDKPIPGNPGKRLLFVGLGC